MHKQNIMEAFGLGRGASPRGDRRALTAGATVLQAAERVVEVDNPFPLASRGADPWQRGGGKRTTIRLVSRAIRVFFYFPAITDTNTAVQKEGRGRTFLMDPGKYRNSVFHFLGRIQSDPVRV